jgi:hypothetical protein
MTNTGLKHCPIISLCKNVKYSNNKLYKHNNYKIVQIKSKSKFESVSVFGLQIDLFPQLRL